MAESTVLRTCRKCNETKPLAEFERDKRHECGHNFLCKKCAVVRKSAYNKSPKGRTAERKFKASDKRKRWEKKYSESTECKEAWKRYNASEKAKLKQKAWATKYRPEHRSEMSARTAVYNAVRDRKMPGAKTLKCSLCGKQARDYHHHKGYARKHWLDVIPVCRRCHREIHLNLSGKRSTSDLA